MVLVGITTGVATGGPGDNKVGVGVFDRLLARDIDDDDSPDTIPPPIPPPPPPTLYILPMFPLLVVLLPLMVVVDNVDDEEVGIAGDPIVKLNGGVENW